jgi:N utilization substance protein A
LAIGRQGQNVRLANRLCDWNIDVKTVEQAAEIDFSEISTVQSARSLFNDEEESFDEITTIAELPGVNKEIADLLIANGFEQIEDFVEAFDNDTIHIEGVTADDLETINGLINENVEFVEEDEDSTNQVENETNESQPEAEEDEYFCPECGAKITLDMTQCPVCGVEFEFEEDEE